MEPEHGVEPSITRETVLDVHLAQSVHAQRVQARRIRIKAGQAAGAHVHNGPVVGSIVEGSVRFRIDGQAETVLRPGDVFFEPAAVEIAHFDALEEDVVFLAYFVLTADQEPEIVMSDSERR